MITKLYSVLCGLIVFSSFGHVVNANEVFGYSLKTDVVYGTGKITKADTVVERDLLMDVYLPSEPSLNTKNKPAIVLVHGGAFHRGGLRQPNYREDGAVHSVMQDWARLLTPQGYACFVIEYRLIPETPIPDMPPDAEGLQPYKEAITDAGLARTNFARGAMGLPPVKKEDKLLLWNGMLSAAEDLNKAVLKVRASAKEYGVDSERIAVGGHSAGGTTVLNAVYGIKSPVKAAFPLSPAVVGYDFSETINSPKLPAMLILMSQFDVDATLESVPHLRGIVENAGLDYSLVWVPGFGHFYPTGAVTLGDDGIRTSVGERVAQFLEKHLKN
ncbi:MAG: alpha/beta hydrolase [Candidatus Thiodiazotropha sp. (ex Monitilora ramsayi)]|nr:alpha/beta hydrolase [Candidatus Thiodiazotropha sp. (ex Monitilora ramsayi)]